MQKANRLIPKSSWRALLAQKRRAINSLRRQEASAILCERLLHRGKLLSFASFDSEIDLWPLNRLLCIHKKLLLPKILDQTIHPFWVTDSETQLDKTKIGILEPNPLICRKADWAEVDAILVPGLGFDPLGFRLGYGKGFYDRLLADVPDLPSIGVGFLEQKVDEALPTDEWDRPVQELLLV